MNLQQAALNTNLTSDGFKQRGLGNGIINLKHNIL